MLPFFTLALVASTAIPCVLSRALLVKRQSDAEVNNQTSSLPPLFGDGQSISGGCSLDAVGLTYRGKPAPLFQVNDSMSAVEALKTNGSFSILSAILRMTNLTEVNFGFLSLIYVST